MRLGKLGFSLSNKQNLTIDKYINRIAVMWKYGGVYSDLDTITLKSFEPLIYEGKNGIGDMFEDFASIGSGVMIFRSKLPYIGYLMEEFTRNYVADKWSINGPQLIAKTLLDYCDIVNIHRHLMPGYLNLQEKTFNMTRLKKPYQNLVYLDKKHKCNNLTIFPQHYFYPFLHVNTLLLNSVFAMKSTLNENYWKAIKSSYSIHFYNRLTFMLSTKPRDKSFYAELASIYCNFTYNYVKENDLYFDSK